MTLRTSRLVNGMFTDVLLYFLTVWPDMPLDGIASCLATSIDLPQLGQKQCTGSLSL